MYIMSEECKRDVTDRFYELIDTAVVHLYGSAEFVAKATELLSRIDMDRGKAFTKDQIDKIASLYSETVANIISNVTTTQREIAMNLYFSAIENIINNS